MQGCIKRHCYPKDNECNYEGELNYRDCKHWQPDRQFKVLRSKRTPDNCPTHVPWDLVLLHEKQVFRNHAQTIERLDERGGLCPQELYAILQDRPFETISEDRAVEFLIAYIRT